MRRLALLCLATIAATNAYNLVIQEISLSGGLITGNLTCDTFQYLHIEGKDIKNECYDVFTTTESKTLASRNLVYTDQPYTTKKKTLNFEVILMDGSKVTFTLSPQTSKVGKQLSTSDTGSKYIPLDSPTTTSPPIETPFFSKAVKKTIIRKPLIPVIGETTTVSPPATKEAAMGMMQIGLRHRGPGPVRPPVGRPPIEDSVVDDDEDEERRIKRDVDPGMTVAVSVTYYTLDEAGNSAAVWAAVIEGIILMVLVGACLYFFCWSPRSRSVAAASADPYKEGPNYTVSYANSSFNNQRIDAFQNPPAAPAAPARPANSSYMDDYVTDNIGARPAAAAAPAASAANPVASDFRPGHQRFDSSGLVTVNLS